MPPTDEDKLKITILLAEYNTLRAEAIAKGSHLFQASTIAAAAVIFLIGALINLLINPVSSSPAVYRVAYGLMVFAFLLSLSGIGIFYWMIWRDLHKAVERVREIDPAEQHRVG